MSGVSLGQRSLLSTGAGGEDRLRKCARLRLFAQSLRLWLVWGPLFFQRRAAAQLLSVRAWMQPFLAGAVSRTSVLLLSGWFVYIQPTGCRYYSFFSLCWAALSHENKGFPSAAFLAMNRPCVIG